MSKSRDEILKEIAHAITEMRKDAAMASHHARLARTWADDIEESVAELNETDTAVAA